MLHLKLTRALGRGVINANPLDVEDVQTRLKAIKHLGQPLYKGKIDGKDGKKTEGAICVFQAKEKLPVTGYIKPGDGTALKLRSKTPQSLKSDIAVSAVTATSAAKMEVQRSLSSGSTDKPLPPDEKRTLDMILKRMQEAHGIPLCFEKLALVEGGHLQAHLTPAKSAV